MTCIDRLRPTSMRIPRFAFGMILTLLASGCGGGSGSAAPQTNNPPSSPASGIGAAGGTVDCPAGAKVVIPAGALASNVEIAVAESGAGAPALPAGYTAIGSIFAFTPHGTHFATPATITVPFDTTLVPAGGTPLLFKTDSSATNWTEVTGATADAGTMSGAVSGFSWVTVVVTLPPPPPKVTLHTFRSWQVAEHHANGNTVDVVTGEPSEQAANINHEFGPLYTVPGNLPLVANAGVYSNLEGTTYATWAQAPHAADPVNDRSSAIGGLAHLQQVQTFVKVTDAASMDLVISDAILEAEDYNPVIPANVASCFKATRLPDASHPTTLEMYDCGNLIDASVSFRVHAFKEIPVRDPVSHTIISYRTVDLAHGTLFAHLYGYIKGEDTIYAAWHFDTGTSGDSNLQFTALPNFHYDDNFDEDPDSTHAVAFLDSESIVHIPLDVVAKDEQFVVVVDVTSDTQNRRQFESYVGAQFRDPQELAGMLVQSEGVEPVAVAQEEIPPPPAIEVLPVGECSTGAKPESGSLQFQTGSMIVNEGGAPGMAPVWVKRSGGGEGEVTVRVATQDGTAHAGVDYDALTTLVRFADGEQGQRYVAVPITNNEAVDSTRELTLTLSDLGGCAVLGTLTTVALTIKDDEAPPPAQTYTLGGTLTGLAGSGLALQTGSGDQVLPAADGPFVFPAALRDGQSYTVSVAVQPANPVQSCTVANGSGTLRGANVTDIAVTCATPAPTGTLDPAFGGGKISNNFSPANSVALQADGKVVVVGLKTLSRYNTDGSLDPTFGTGGKVDITMNGGAFEAMEAVAVQADGKIVVAGHTSTAPSLVQDFALQRFNTDGSLDATFGSGGKVVTDFAGNEDAANALALEANGSIVAAGITIVGSGSAADEDFAVARYLPDGSLDAGFGSGGKASANVGGKVDIGHGVAVQGDGKVVVAGRVAVDGGSDPDFGVVRFTVGGQLDEDFEIDGKLQIQFAPNIWDEAQDVAIAADGKIIVGGFAAIGDAFQYALVRLQFNGTLDNGFGESGRVSTTLASKENFGRAMALQSDGKIVIAGQVSSLANGDFGVVRVTTDGDVDSTFGTAGLVNVDFFGANDNAQDVAVQADGKILVVGSIANGSAKLGMARIAP